MSDTGRTPLSHWIWFHVLLLALLAFELGFSRFRLPRDPGPARAARQHRNAIAATLLWIAAAALTALYFWRFIDAAAATQFLAGYALEQSLSVDNLFLFLLLFRAFKIPPAYQPRVLFWGVLGAIVMRGLFIAGGLVLLARFHWVETVFGLILLVAAVRLLLPGEPEDSEKQPPWTRWLSRIHPVSLSTDVFFTTENGRRVVTMLFIALLAIELTDVVFALDSIPAVLSITRHPFIAYTSNILAVMGLRSLFFLLASMLKRLRYLHFGLAAILFFAAAKILLARWYVVAPLPSLAVILALLGLTVAASLLSGEPAESSLPS